MPKVTVECENCGTEKDVYPSRVRERNYCNVECKSSWESKNRVGESHHQYEKIELNCNQCGCVYKVQKNRKEKSNYCSRECKDNSQKQSMVGENNPNWETDSTVVCFSCDKEFTIPQSRVGVNEKSFCSRNCYGDWLSENRVKENHPRWKGGHKQYYGKSWYAKRKKVRERDNNICQKCEDDETDMGQRPAVHHIIPVRKFDDPNDAHTMNNMVQLCQSCHMEMEMLDSEKQREIVDINAAVRGQDQTALGGFV